MRRIRRVRATQHRGRAAGRSQEVILNQALPDETLPPSLPVPTGGARPRAQPLEVDGTPPDRIGPYRVIERLGVGGMGVVYKCHDETLNRHVALKVLQQKFASDEHYRQRFHREARTIASLSHPAIAHVYGIGESPSPSGPVIYIIMELVDGPSAETLIQREGALPLDRAVALVRDTALGLEAAFAKGIVHRDVKPSNLLVTGGGGSVKIVDFGLAKEIGSNSMTAEGIVLGTPHFISPEQGRGRPVDHRSDIYSLGATLYNLVTGRPPFDGASQVSVIVAHVNDAPPLPHLVHAGLPPSVSRIVLRMMAKAPEDRYQRYRDIIEDLDALLAGREPVHAPALPEAPASGSLATTMALPGRGVRARLARRRVLQGAGAAALVAVLTLAFILARPGGPTAARAALGSWHRIQDGRDVLEMNFASPPDERPGAESWRRFIIPAHGDELDGSRPQLSGKMLHWKGFTLPFACGVAFDSIDSVEVLFGPTSGTFDLGLSLVDPIGAERRQLLLRLRPVEGVREPIVATRSGEAVAATPVPPVPRLGQGPYQVRLGLEAAGGDTRVHVTISRRQGSRPIYDAACTLPGSDWGSGVLVLRTASSIRGLFEASIARIRITGAIAEDGFIEEVPWRSS